MKHHKEMAKTAKKMGADMKNDNATKQEIQTAKVKNQHFHYTYASCI